MAGVVFVDEQRVRLVLEQMRAFFSGVDGKELLHKILMKQEPNPTDELKTTCKTVEDDDKQEVRTSLEEKLVETLKCLSEEEFEEFKGVLQQTDMKDGILRIPRHRMKTSHRAEIVELMMEVYGRRSVEVTREVLEKMNKKHLVLRLSHISSGSKDKHQSKVFQEQEVRTSLEEKLVETLKCLSEVEFEEFKGVLQHMKDGLLRIPRHRMKTSHSAEIVELMMEVYGRRSVEVTREVLEKMNKKHLVLRLSHISSGSKADGDSRRRAAATFRAKGVLELQGCGNMKQDCSDWTKVNPEVNSTDPDEAPTYSLQSGAGAFECTVSGLRWVCKEKVTFKYKFCCLDEAMLRIKQMEYTPAGPLMDVTVTAGQFDEVYLPHWIHIEDNPTITDKFAVLTIHDCGDVVEKVSEVTSSHVKLSEPSFSLRMVLVKAGWSVAIKCKVLIYKTNTAFLTLHVYLIPDDPGLQQELDRKNLSSGYTRIKKPYPEKHLTMNDRFILTADLDAAEIYPERLMLSYDSSDPNFFEVFVENPKTNFKLGLRQEDEHQPIWSCDIRKNEYQTTKAEETDENSPQPGCSSGEHFVDEHQVELKRRVSEVGIILDELLHKQVISQESFDRIRVLPNSQEKMRELCSLLLKAGTSCKDIFYKILEKNEPYLIADLKKKK